LFASNITLILHIHSPIFSGGRFDRMVVGFMTTYAISAYHPVRGDLYSIQHYVIKFVS